MVPLGGNTPLVYQAQSLVIDTKGKYGKRVPMDLCGDLFRQLYPMMGHSVRMAVEGTSATVGAQPAWLHRASDVRVLGFSEKHGKTLLKLEAPTLGDAAKDLYSQNAFWETRPPQEDTAINVFARVMLEVRKSNLESTLFDRPLLRRFSHLQSLFAHDLLSVLVPGAANDTEPTALLDEQVVRNAAQLSDRTPPPAQIRLTGKLDMIRHSTRSFGLVTDEGSEVRGVLDSQEQTDSLKSFLGRRILVLGKAIFRPSGSLLRIDASGVETGEGQPSLFSKVPQARNACPQLVRNKTNDIQKRGVAAFFGTWPGEETDQDFDAMVKELRG
jgi:hypothetical protein